MSSSTTTPAVPGAPDVRRAAALPPHGAKVASRRRAGPWGLALGALVVLAGALSAATLAHRRQEQRVDAAAAEAATAPMRVTVVSVRAGDPYAERVLPGSSMPLLEAALYPRATGYVKTRLVDIGDRVHEGQLLAVIAAPDLDDQLAQARANLEQARATLKLNEANAVLARSVLQRSLRIARADGLGGAVTQEEIDQQRASVGTTVASVGAAQASIRVNEATVQRFTDLQQFENITAPFPGVITARHIDPGDLLSADSTTRELFHLMRTDVLRVFVNVPQVFATGIKVGQHAAVYLREAPQKQYPGAVTRTADALDPGTRTLLTEVQVPNPKDALRPGMYLQVKFVFDRAVRPVMIPAAALATRSGGPRVAVLDDRHRVQYRQVQLGRDFGTEIQVTAGLKPGETVVVHPGDDIPEGTAVEPVPLSR